MRRVGFFFPSSSSCNCCCDNNKLFGISSYLRVTKDQLCGSYAIQVRSDVETPRLINENIVRRLRGKMNTWGHVTSNSNVAVTDT